MNVAQHVERGARLFPERSALLFENETFSYARLNAESNRAANGFGGLGIGRGDRVAIWLPNTAAFVIAYLGVHKLGAIAVTINTALTADEIQFILDDCGAHLLITTAALHANLVGASLPHIRHIVLIEGEAAGTGAFSTLLSQASPERSSAEMAPEEPAVLLYTSGTTGFPKGALLSHQNVLAGAQTVIPAFGLRPEDRVLLCLSAFHSFGQTAALNPCFEVGATLVLHRQFESAPVLASIAEQQATIFFGVPTLYLLLHEQARPEQLRSVRRYISAGAPLPVTRARKWQEKYGVPINEGYGLTEVCLVTYNADPEAYPGSVGKPLAGVQVLVVNDAGEVVAPGELGQVVVNSPCALLGYWNRPAETAAALRAGWFHTGDMGRLDDTGRLYIVDRIKDMINVGGVKVYPAEVERVLYQHPAVAEVAVYGAPEALLGEQVQASVVLKRAHVVTAQALIAFCQERLAEFKTPQQIEFVDELPKNRSGKILKRILRQRAAVASRQQPPGNGAPPQAQPTEAPSHAPAETLSARGARENKEATLAPWMASWLAAELRMPVQQIDWEKPFAEYGVTSIMAVNFARALSEWLGRPFPAILLWNFPTIAQVVRRLSAEDSVAQAQPTDHPPAPQALSAEPIALIGIGCRFPGAADTPDKFWTLVRDGVDAVGAIPAGRWNVEQYYDPNPTAPGKMYVRAGCFLDGIDQFDAQFFGVSPLEAASMDPQQRLLLEVCWEALEHADLAADRLRSSRSGVFVGAFWDDYSTAHLYNANPDQIDGYRLLSHLRGMFAGRLAYTLGFHGPTMQLDTACSSSLLAVHLACQSLRSRECDLALAGGVSLTLSPEQLIGLCQMRALAPDGRCKTFAAEADGFGVGEGVGIVVLKRFSDAVRDGDRILALIRGSAVNHDGASNGLTAPNGQAQEAMLRQALENAAVQPGQIQYIETHGTGTALGDPIEVQALLNVFGDGRAQPLFLGSVKTNIGHLSAAAGIASLIKVALALSAGEIPPSLHFTTPNPLIPWSTAPVVVPTARLAWPPAVNDPTHASDGRRLAGVSSFGLTGTNVHLIVEEPPLRQRNAVIAGAAPDPAVAPAERPYHLLALSAKSDQALNAQREQYEHFLTSQPALAWADICHTAATGRVHWAHRMGIVAPDATTAGAKLQRARLDATARGIIQGKTGESAPKVALLFPGQGPQYVNMGRQLYETQSLFRRTVNDCAEILQNYLDQSLLTILYGADQAHAEAQLDQATYAQPALFAIEYALATLWQSWGIEPAVVIGHSLGEYVAACLAGVFSLEDGLRFVAERSRLMQVEAPKGQMMAVLGAEAQVSKILEPYARQVTLAAINTPTSLVIAGSPAAIHAAGEALRRAEIETRPLKIHVASHSPLMEPILARFAAVAHSITYHRPRLQVVSNLTGQIAGDELTTPEYWCRHLRESVRFAQGIATVAQLGIDTFVEAGPKTTLLGLSQQCLPQDSAHLWLPSIQPKAEDWLQLLESLAALYVRGAAINWQGLGQDYSRTKVPVPVYPFQRRRYWIDIARPTLAPDAASPQARDPHVLPGAPPRTEAHPLLGRQVHSVVAARNQELLFENRLESGTLGYLADHTVFDQVIVPGAAYLEMILAAGRQAQPGRQLIIEECAFQQALFLPFPASTTATGAAARDMTEPAPGTTVQVVLTPAQSSPRAAHERPAISPARRAAETGYTWQIYSQGDAPPSAADWTLHASGKIVAAHAQTQPAPPAIDLAELRARCHTAVDLTSHDRRLRQQGIAYGPHFQALTQLFVGDGEALGFVNLPPALAGTTGGYNLHPVLLDACLRVAGALVADAPDPYLPFSMDRLHLFHPGAPAALWSHVRRRPVSPMHAGPDDDVSPPSYQVDVTLFDAQGQVVALVTDFTLRRASRQLLSGNRPRGDWLYEIAWQPADDRTQSPDAHEPGRWLILADRKGRGAALAADLETHGEQCDLVFRAALPESIADAAPFSRLLDAEGQDTPVRLRGVVYLWGLDTLDVSAEQIPAAAVQTTQQAFHLVQALVQAKQTARVWLVTQGAIGEGVAEVQVQQAPLWGLGRTIHWEHPELNCTCVDLTDDVSPAALFTELWFADDARPPDQQENQILLRREGRLVARLVRQRVPTARPLILDPDGSYLVTGGLGGLGLQTAQWLVAQGARHLVLAGRSGATTPATRAVIQSLERAGAQVVIIRADVSNQADVRRLLQASAAAADGSNRLRGIIHAAGVIEDGILLNQTAQRFERVMAPKVAGSWHLHTLTRELPLDFFVCFSSVSSLLGNGGQGNYAAANAFMDALAQRRHREGKPALSINWGGWSEVGLAADLVKQTQAAGLGAISPAQGIRFLNLLMTGEAAQVGVLPIDWRKFRDTLPDRAQFPLLAEWIEPAGEAQHVDAHFASADATRAPEPSPGQNARQRLAAAPPDARAHILKGYVRDLALKLLGTTPDDQESFARLGLDSLASIQLANRLGALLDLSLPATLAFKYETIDRLTQFLLAALERTLAVTAPADGYATAQVASEPAVKTARVVDTDWYPQLYNQRELYVWHEQATNKASLHIQQSFHIRSRVDERALAAALQALVDRHEALRTVFARRDADLIQRTLATHTVDFAAVNLENRSWHSAADAILAAARQPFDLAHGPLLRGRLFSRAADDHVFLLVVHHIVADATALSVIVNELWSLYRAFQSGRAPSLPPISTSWVDFVRWQTTHLAGAEGERLWGYWQKQLAGDLPPLNLPTDYPRPQTDSHDGRPCSLEIDARLTQQLRQLAQQEGCTLYMVLMAAFQILLRRYTEQRDITVAAHVANRNDDRFAGTVGYLADTVAIRTEIPAQATFTSVLHQVQATILAAMEHQGLPLRLLAERLHVQEHPTRPVICQVWFTLLPLRLFQESRGLFQTGHDAIQIAGLTLESSDIIPAWLGAWYDLEMILTEGESVVFGTLVYKTDLFAESTIQRMITDFRNLLTEITADPNLGLDTLTLAPVKE